MQPYQIELLVLATTSYLVVLSLGRVFALLGKIRKPRFFISRGNKKRRVETKRVENVTAEIILRLLDKHRKALENIGAPLALESYQEMVRLILEKYPQARP